MPEKYLYEKLVEEFGRRYLSEIAVSASIKENLNSKFELRPYQIDTFQRFICYFEKEFDFKQYPSHLLFNMATGSGKTLIMAGLILYLYEKGYRNFLFFVHLDNILGKTKDNFLNPSSSKYLFNQNIVIGNRRVNVSAVGNFENSNPNDINICFTTMSGLHSAMTTDRENSLTYEDFRKHKVVLIADEAHHMNVQTKSDIEMFESWENTVQKIFEQNTKNILLEFTATHDYTTPEMVEKYRNKVIIRYDLKEFRNDKFSKDITLIYSDFDLDERILQALILSQYKQEVAAKHRINLKPVILFKAQKTILESQENKVNFHKIVEGLNTKHIAKIRKSNIEIVKRAFQFFEDNKISDGQLVERLKLGFQEDFCVSVNDDKEKEKLQILLNSLEDTNNHIRAIFAVQKLNEGWDVLNLFDIVRCYEPRDTGRAKIGTTTMSEAQLIGRGMRYFPFQTAETAGLSDVSRDRRKFDNNIYHELRVLEELHYHSINNNRYIPEITQALKEQGAMDENEVKRELKLKEGFKKTQFYKYGVIYANSAIEKDYKHVKSFADLGVKKKNYVHVIATGHGGTQTVLASEKQSAIIADNEPKDIQVKDINLNIVQSAVARNPFYTFANIKKYFPHLPSMSNFMVSKDYLGGLEITFQGNLYNLEENFSEHLAAISGLLNKIETEIRQQNTDYQGSKEFKPSRIHEIFYDKTLKFSIDNVRGKEDPQFEHDFKNKDWFTVNTIYGTSEEKAFVHMLDRHIEKIKEQYESIYLLRNEGHFAIYNFPDGATFQPDFVLFLQEKNGKSLTYQLFIEPKGGHLAEKDRWKENFLKEIKEEFGKKQILKLEDKKYCLFGVPFYDNENENIFRENLESALSV